MRLITFTSKDTDVSFNPKSIHSLERHRDDSILVSVGLGINSMNYILIVKDPKKEIQGIRNFCLSNTKGEYIIAPRED